MEIIERIIGSIRQLSNYPLYLPVNASLIHRSVDYSRSGRGKYKAGKGIPKVLLGSMGIHRLSVLFCQGLSLRAAPISSGRCRSRHGLGRSHRRDRRDGVAWGCGIVRKEQCAALQRKGAYAAFACGLWKPSFLEGVASPSSFPFPKGYWPVRLALPIEHLAFRHGR